MKITEEKLKEILIELHKYYFKKQEEINMSDMQLTKLIADLSNREYEYIHLQGCILTLETIMLQVFGGQEFFKYFLSARLNENAEVFEKGDEGKR